MDHQDVPFDEIYEAEDGVVGAQNKILLFFVVISARITSPLRNRGDHRPRASEAQLTPQTQAYVSLLRRRRVARTTRQGVDRAADAEEHQKGHAAPEHCGRLLECPPPTCLLAGARKMGTKGKGRVPVPRPCRHRRRCPPFPPSVGGGGGGIAAVRCLVASGAGSIALAAALMGSRPAWPRLGGRTDPTDGVLPRGWVVGGRPCPCGGTEEGFGGVTAAPKSVRQHGTNGRSRVRHRTQMMYNG